METAVYILVVYLICALHIVPIGFFWMFFKKFQKNIKSPSVCTCTLCGFLKEMEARQQTDDFHSQLLTQEMLEWHEMADIYFHADDHYGAAVSAGKARKAYLELKAYQEKKK